MPISTCLMLEMRGTVVGWGKSQFLKAGTSMDIMIIFILKYSRARSLALQHF